jgi:dienelactone hydrolase
VNDIAKPISVAVGDNDIQLGAVGLKNLKANLDARAQQYNLKHEVVVYLGAKHGFAVRGDPSEEVQKRQGQEAEDQAIAWFSQCFSDIK